MIFGLTGRYPKNLPNVRYQRDEKGRKMLTFEDIARKPQQALKKILISELTRMGYRTRTKKGFLYAEGSLPVMLVAHLDTVHKKPVKTICYSADGNIVMSPEGIGGDDRAGVYMILQIIRRHRCHVLFCEDEETGGVGAHEFAGSDIKPDINYIVELDRRGSNDAVFYDCDNPEFTKFVTGFGFKEEMGSFSDIAIIAPELQVAAVNISAGYYCEHSRHEYVDLRVMDRNIELVGEMVAAPSEKFEYIEVGYFRRHLLDGRYDEEMLGFDRYYRGIRDVEIKTLMPLPDSAHIKMPDGKIEECECEQYMIDNTGKVYEYLYDLCVAVEVDGGEARAESNMPARFKGKDALEVEVVPVEFVRDCYVE